MCLLQGGKDALYYECTWRSQCASTDVFLLTLRDQLSNGLVSASKESFQDHGNHFSRRLHKWGDPNALSMPHELESKTLLAFTTLHLSVLAHVADLHHHYLPLPVRRN